MKTVHKVPLPHPHSGLPLLTPAQGPPPHPRSGLSLLTPAQSPPRQFPCPLHSHFYIQLSKMRSLYWCNVNCAASALMPYEGLSLWTAMVLRFALRLMALTILKGTKQTFGRKSLSCACLKSSHGQAGQWALGI